MRSPEAIFEELEADRAQREAEIRLIENIATRSSGGDQSALRRSLVLVTYAHLEGFCKFALTAYAAAINALKLPCREAATPLVAASLSRAFSALRDPQKKHPVFRKTLPHDPDLHMLWREQLFVENFGTLAEESVAIPDSAVDTKSNLNTVILKRNLYQLGLDHTVVESYAGRINELLNRRNAIAHGDRMENPSAEQARSYVEATFAIMSFVQQVIYGALHSETYRRSPADSAA